MTLLRDLSAVWSLLHVLVIFIIFYESRYPRKKTIMLTLCFMGPLIIFDFWFFLHFGAEKTGQALLLICTLPSLIFFFVLAKYRDGRFFFTFCLADTVALEIVYITNLIDYYLPGDIYLVMFLLRLVSFPVLEFGVLKWLKGPYAQMQKSVKKGWGGFVAIAALFYVLMTMMFSFPELVTERPEYLPPVILVMILMPCMYWCIFFVLSKQQELHHAQGREQLLQMRSAMMRQRVEQTTRAEEQLAIQRHDLRHRFQTLDAMLEKGEVQAAREYITSAEEILAETTVKRWCLNPVLDAVFTSYFRQAEAEHVRVEADMDIPVELHVDAAELSTVFANALENAIHAVRQLPEGERVIRCKCIRYPKLMLRVSNPYAGKVRFDDRGRPMAAGPDHGIGTRSIAAYCEKHGAYCDYKAENGWFTIQIVQP